MRDDILLRRDDIEKWINEHRSNAFMCRELLCKPETLRRYLDIMHITYAGNRGGAGQTKQSALRMCLTDYLAHSQDVQTNKIRNKLLEEGYKERVCERCGRTTWEGEPIPLSLHHIDGNRHNNTIENFQLLCPNCHALTDSYCGKNSRKNN